MEISPITFVGNSLSTLKQSEKSMQLKIGEGRCECVCVCGGGGARRGGGGEGSGVGCIVPILPRTIETLPLELVLLQSVQNNPETITL